MWDFDKKDIKQLLDNPQVAELMEMFMKKNPWHKCCESEDSCSKESKHSKGSKGSKGCKNSKESKESKKSKGSKPVGQGKNKK